MSASVRTPGLDDPALAELVAEFTDRLNAGEAVDVGEYAARLPGRAAEVRELLGALQLVGATGGCGPATVGGLPEVLGDFRVVREVGRGGMGVVYEAEQLALGRRVALKVLPFAATLDPRHLQRFHNEARAAASLHHPNIVPVYAVGCERGVHYFAMQLIDGRSLAAVIRGLRPGPAYPAPPTGPDATPAQANLTTARHTDAPGYFRSVARLGAQAADALEHAHQLGVIHRDVKPANLMVDAAGALWITDFGLARLVGDAGPTRTGDLLGTLRYMSPEQALGRPGLVDHRTDVYSLGASLYELLTLRPPFPAEEKVELLRAIADDEPVPPRRLDRAVPAELETVVLKAMAKSPADRYATARELADDLRRFVDDRPILARPPTPLQRLRRWARKHRPAVWAASVAASVALLTVVVGLTASNLAIAAQRDKARKAETERTSQLYNALVSQAQANRLAGRVGARAEALRAIEAAARLIPTLEYGRDQELMLRNEALACLALPDTEVERRWRGYPAGSWSVALDAGFAHSARSDDEDGIVVRRVADDAEVFRATVTGALPVRLSPDGRFLAASHRRPGGKFGDENRLTTVWDTHGGKAVLELDGQRGMDFSSDCRWLAIAEADGTVRVYELPGMVERASVQTGHAVPRGASSIRLGPGGKRLAAWGHTGGLEVWDVDPPRLLTSIPHRPSGFAEVDWHPDGSRLAVALGEAVHVYDARVNWGTLPSSVRHPGLSGLWFDSTGDLLCTESADDTTRVWDVSGPKARGRQLVEVVGVPVPPVFRADGRAVAVRLGPELQVVRVEPSAECRVLDHSPFGVSAQKSMGYSRDSRVLVAPAAREARLWELSTGRELVRLPGSLAGFHPGGEWLLTLRVREGIHRWPIRTTRVGDHERWDVGPPVRVVLPVGAPIGRLGSGHPCEGGHALAVGYPNELLIANPTAGTLRRVPTPGYSVHTMTADGRRAVAQAEQLPYPWRVLEVETGRVIFEMLDVKPVGRSYQFSPDDRLLAVCSSGEVALYDAGSWAPRGRFSYADVTDRILPQVTFSPDGRALAVAGVRRGLQLLDLTTGAEFATLSGPGDPQLSRPSVSPDGRWLTAHAGSLDVYVWDLPRLAGRLGGLGLADGWPFIPPAEPTAAGSVTVVVDLGELAGAVPPADRGEKKSSRKP